MTHSIKVEKRKLTGGRYWCVSVDGYMVFKRKKRKQVDRLASALKLPLEFDREQVRRDGRVHKGSWAS